MFFYWLRINFNLFSNKNNIGRTCYFTGSTLTSIYFQTKKYHESVHEVVDVGCRTYILLILHLTGSDIMISRSNAYYREEPLQKKLPLFYGV